MTTEPTLGALQSHMSSGGGRLYVGAVPGGLALADPQHAVLVLGPPRAGKTSGVAVPNVLAAPAAVVATSTKPDILHATREERSAKGRCWLLDPTGTVEVPPGVTRVRWSPAAAASTWDESLVIARSLTGAARPAGRHGESAHWTERSEALLAPLLHAANLRGGGIEEVLRWVLRHDVSTATSTLAANGVDLAVDVLSGIAATDGRELSGIWSSTAGILAAYRSDAVLDNSGAVNFDPRDLHAGGDTVYICAPARHQELVAPIVVSFLDQARAGAYRAASAAARTHLTLVLDEVANIAPLPDLPALVSEGGSQGVLTMALLQDLSQARLRWGAAADGFLSLFGTKLVLPGIGDLRTLDLVSRLGGEIDIPSQSRSYGPWWSTAGSATVSWSPHRQRRLPVEAVNQQRRGQALLICGARGVETVGLPPWWEVQPFAGGRRNRAVGVRPQAFGPDPSRDLTIGR